MAKIRERNLGQTGEGRHIKMGLKKMCTLEFQIKREDGISGKANFGQINKLGECSKQGSWQKSPS